MIKMARRDRVSGYQSRVRGPNNTRPLHMIDIDGETLQVQVSEEDRPDHVGS